MTCARNRRKSKSRGPYPPTGSTGKQEFPRRRERNERVAQSCHRAKTSTTTARSRPITLPRLMRPSRWRGGRVHGTRNHTIESWITINSIYVAVGWIRRERDSGFREGIRRHPRGRQALSYARFDVHLITRQPDIGFSHWPRTANSFSTPRRRFHSAALAGRFSRFTQPVFHASHFAVRSPLPFSARVS